MFSERDKLFELLARWADGEAVDWRALHAGEPPPITRAPSYPFARKRYWFEARPAGGDSQQGVDMSRPSDGPHQATREVTCKLPDVATVLDVSPGPARAKPSHIMLHPLDAPDAPDAPDAQSRAGARPVAPPAPAQPRDVEALRVELAQRLASYLRVAPGDIGPDTSFVELGVDSLISAEWARELGGRYGAPIGAEALLRHDTLSALAQMLAGSPRAAGERDAPRASTPPASALPASGLPASGLPASGLPASGLPASVPPPSGLPASGLPASGLPASGLPASAPVVAKLGSSAGRVGMDDVVVARATPAVPVPVPVGPSKPQLEKELAASLAQALYMEVGDIDLNQPFVEMGLDSIIGVEWIADLNRQYAISMQAIQVYEYPDITQLAGLVEQEIRRKAPRVAASSGEPSAPVRSIDAAPVAERVPVRSIDAAPVEERAPRASELAVAPAQDLAGAAAPPATLLDDLVDSLARALFKQPAEIDVTRPLSDAGLDPIVEEDWLQRTSKQLGIAIRAQDAHASRSIAELADQLARARTPAPRPDPKLEAGIEVPLRAKAGSEPAAQPRPEPRPELRLEPRTEPRPEPRPEPRSTPEPALAAPRAPVVARATAPHREPIAIVGMSGRYPGARDLEDYWENLVAGRCAIREVPASRWDVERHYDRPGTPGKTYSKWLGALDDVDCFDPAFFKISPAEAEEMDPQHRIFLEEGYKVFERMGCAAGAIDNTSCGVYLGIMNQEYRYLADRAAVTMLEKSNSYAIGAARLAYHLNLKGPAIPVDTACSSALVATHLACQALRAGEIDLAVVGGVTLYLTEKAYLEMCSARMLAPDGRCKAFDDAADGFVPGEAVGVLVLKRLGDAERDGDHIAATIIGSGINQDGRTNGITAPSVTSQTELVREVYRKHGIDPETIGYVEAHGTGTKVGDPVELTALAAAFRDQTQKTAYCALGSVKTNIGHTSAAAGVAALHKVLLCLQHRELVPSLNFQTPNRYFDFAGSPFYVNTEHKRWDAPNGAPRRAAVSSFGFSGTNAHVVLEEYVRPAATVAPATGPVAIPLSARTPERLTEYAARLLEFVTSGAGAAADLADLAYTLQVGRTAMEERIGVLAHSRDELAAQLRSFVEGRPPADGVHVRRGRGDDDALAQLAADDDIAAAIEAWLRKGKLGQLLGLWVRGVAIDWARLHAGAPRRRIVAPTYPFARERYWVKDRRVAEVVPAPAGAALHLVHHEPTSRRST